MLKLVTREKVNTRTITGGIVLNTDFISEVQTTETTKAKFKFFARPEDRRGGKDDYVVTESRATITTAMNQSFTAVGITLNVYPDNDSTKSVVATLFNVAEIVMAYAHTASDRTKCWIEVNEKGWKVKKYLVAHYYVDVADIARTGTTTTTTSTTS